MKPLSKAQLGSVGETLVLAKILERGYSAFNANLIHNNYPGIDLVAFQKDSGSQNPKLALVQVKTSDKTSFPVGYSIERAKDRIFLEEHVRGPYVFVHQREENGEWQYDFYILSKSQFIDLLVASHEWYYSWPRDKQLNGKSVAALSLNWLQGGEDKETKQHGKFANPFLGKSFKNCWDNIWLP